MYRLSRERLAVLLRIAYADACRSKRRRGYVVRFESKLDYNLNVLCDELMERSYVPGSSQCFIINDPKKREVFAAEFRDRIVHHLYYNMVHTMLERTFIQDSYSCIKGRGTHYGVRRLEHHIRSASSNYTQPCYVLKLDIKGYFMHIDRCLLLKIVLEDLGRLAVRRCAEGGRRARWCDVVDMEFVEYLTKVFVMHNPLSNCSRRGCLSDWEGLPREKSLFHSPEGCGLPIGNLTSQLFSNVFLNRLDQYMKRSLGCRHYGRYVDDFFVVGVDRRWLVRLVPHVRRFLSDELGLRLHEGKIVLADVCQGVVFLGAYVKPWRRYVEKRTLKRMGRKLSAIGGCEDEPHMLESRLNSYMGVLSHGRSYGALKRMMLYRNDFWYAGDFVRRHRKWCFESV